MPIAPEKLAKLEEKHPDSIIIGVVNGKTHEKTLISMARTPANLEKLVDRFGFGEEMHGAVIEVHAPTQAEFEALEAAKRARMAAPKPTRRRRA